VVYGLVIGTLFFSYNATLQGKHNFYFVRTTMFYGSSILKYILYLAFIAFFWVFFLPPQGYGVAVIGKFLIIFHFFKYLKAISELSFGYKSLYLDYFGL
jgi:hypothetical protein